MTNGPSGKASLAHLAVLSLLEAGKHAEASRALRRHLVHILKNLGDIRELLRAERMSGARCRPSD